MTYLLGHLTLENLAIIASLFTAVAFAADAMSGGFKAH